MKALDDILFGLFIFFAVDRLFRLSSNAFIEPFIEKRTHDVNMIENWKLFFEFLLLTGACFVVFVYKKPLSRLVA